MVVGVDPSPVEGCFVGPVVIRYIARSDLLLSPHMGYGTEEYIGQMYDGVVQNVERYLAGEALLAQYN